MADRTQAPHDDKVTERRSPITDDLDPVGMDSEHETDELEASDGEFGPDDDVDNDEVEPDGVSEGPRRH
jgi:hypothetical protein